MRRTTRWIPAWIVIAFSCAASAQVLEQTFSDSLAGFKISTPNQSWRLEPRGIDPGEVKLVLRFEFPLHQFIPNLTVRVSPSLKATEKPEEVLEEALRQFPENFTVVRKKPVTHRGVRGFELLMEEKATGLLFQQWFFVGKGKTFILTGTAKAASFSRVEADFLKMLQSFEII